jgi:hypothetical protein
MLSNAFMFSSLQISCVYSRKGEIEQLISLPFPIRSERDVVTSLIDTVSTGIDDAKRTFQVRTGSLCKL